MADEEKKEIIMVSCTYEGQYLIYEQEYDKGQVIGWKEPMMIQIRPPQPGQNQPSVSMVPLVQFGLASINTIDPLPKDKLLATYPPNPMMTKSYKDLILKLRAARAGISVEKNMPGASPSGPIVLDLDPKAGSAHRRQ